MSTKLYVHACTHKETMHSHCLSANFGRRFGKTFSLLATTPTHIHPYILSPIPLVLVVLVVLCLFVCVCARSQNRNLLCLPRPLHRSGNRRLQSGSSCIQKIVRKDSGIHSAARFRQAHHRVQPGAVPIDITHRQDQSDTKLPFQSLCKFLVVARTQCHPTFSHRMQGLTMGANTNKHNTQHTFTSSTKCNGRDANVHATFVWLVNVPRTFGESKCVRKVDVSGFRHILIDCHHLTKFAYIHFPNTFEILKSTRHVQVRSERGTNVPRTLSCSRM